MEPTIKLIIEVVLLALLYWLEWAFPLFKERKSHLKHASTNITMGIINVLLVSLLFSTAAVLTIEWSHTNLFGLSYLVEGPFWLQAVIAFLLFDLWMYIWHRANHRIPLLWLLHRTHHSDTQMDFSTGLRFHPIEIILSSVFRLAVFPLVGITYSTLVIYEICLQIIVLFHHSNIGLPEKWDKLLRAIIVTPNMHRVHHSKILPETHSNFSSVFSFWDRLFATFRKREDILNIEYGLEEFREKKWQTVIGMLKTPLGEKKQEYDG